MIIIIQVIIMRILIYFADRNKAIACGLIAAAVTFIQGMYVEIQ